MKTMLKRITAVLVTILVAHSAYSQDFLLSQPWAISSMVAPSFAGFNLGGRAFMTYRNQYSSLKGSHVAIAGYDQYFHPMRSSFGANIAYSNYAGGMLSQTEFNIQYNYTVQMATDWYFRPGLQLGLFYRTIDPSKMIFADQIAADGTFLPTSSFNPVNTSVVRFDAGVSVLFYYKYFFAGLHADNLLGNKISFTDQAETTNPIKISAYAAGMIPISKGLGKYDAKDDVTIAALYQWQGQYHQIDFDIMYHRRYFMAGVGYRGVPFYTPEGLQNQDAVKLMIGGSVAGFSLSYNYDISVSSLVDVSGGSHEIVLTYRFMEKAPNDRSFFCY
ncbi:MAG: PorP/SprF family type IX secretion system membrane protein [Paludibacteraceae bacterium]|nr:PorP/SprF family type IX secretion system membrane protein [Paludibacteraceae bacterium]